MKNESSYLHEKLNVIVPWAGFNPGATRNVALWADRHRRLTKHASQYAGRWKTDRFPYQRGPMEAFSNNKTRLVVMKWGTQLGKTECLLNDIGWAIDEAPGPVLVVYPNSTTVKKISTTRIQPMINSCPSLVAKKHLAADKFKITEMHFSDCLLYLSSAEVPADLASMPIQYLFCDEVGKFPKFSGREGDPVKLAKERQKAFPYTSKTVLVSSPTTPDGPVSQYFQNCEERLYFFLPCPHCQDIHVLSMDHIKWETGEYATSDPLAWREAEKTAQYFCPHCGAEITNNQKIKMLQGGRWLREDGVEPDIEATSIGFELSSLYSPLIKWGTVAAEFLEAKQETPRLMVFVNGWLCQDWEDAVIVQKDPDIILQQNKTVIPPMIVPADAIALTMGVDSQASGFYYVVRAWMRDHTSYLIDYGYLGSLQEIEEIINYRSYRVENQREITMGIWRAAIDTGGTRLYDGPSMTEQIYMWLRGQTNGRVFGIKGRSGESDQWVVEKAIDKMPDGKPIPGGLRLFILDTGAFKNEIHRRLEIDPEKPRAFLFHSETTDSYAMMLLSEYKRRDAKTGKESWVTVRGRENHYLDCEVYCMACANRQFRTGIDALVRPAITIGAPKKSRPKPQQRRQPGYRRPSYLDR